AADPPGCLGKHFGMLAPPLALARPDNPFHPVSRSGFGNGKRSIRFRKRALRAILERFPAGAEGLACRGCQSFRPGERSRKTPQLPTRNRMERVAARQLQPAGLRTEARAGTRRAGEPVSPRPLGASPTPVRAASARRPPAVPRHSLPPEARITRQTPGSTPCRRAPIDI